MLKLENITFSYDNETEALKNVTLNIEKGKKTLFLRGKWLRKINVIFNNERTFKGTERKCVF